MGTGRARRAARMLAATGMAAALTAVPGTAQAATEYDGDATALRIEGLQLQLLPGAADGAPEQLRPLVDEFRKLQAQGPEQLQRDSLTLAMPDQVIGQARFPGTDTQGEIPPNPLLTAEVLEAKSVKAANGSLVSEASVTGLSIGGGALMADVIRTTCVGNGERMTLDVSQLKLSSNQDIVQAEVRLQPGQTVPIEGLGTITYNQQDTDGSTYAEGTNVVIDLDSDLSLEALARVFDTTAPAVEAALREVLRDLSQMELGPDHTRPFEKFGENVDALSGQELYHALDQVTDEVDKGSRQLPPELRNALNNLAHLDGTITIANAACAQQAVAAVAPQPQAPQEAVPAQPVAAKEPPLADTGSPAGMLGMALAGIAALVAGGLTLLRLRRREV